jgi:hypothetical protein
VRITVACLGLAVAAALAGPGAVSSPAARADTPASVEFPAFVPSGPGYQAGLNAEVSFWNDTRLAEAGLDANPADTSNGTDGQGVDAVAPPDGWDNLSSPWAGGGEIAKASGKLFMEQFAPDNSGGGTTYYSTCSATVVDSANQSVILAAGHCITENWGLAPVATGPGVQDYSENAVFIPAFNGARLPRPPAGTEIGVNDTSGPMPDTSIAPYGVWGVTQEWITSSWNTQANNFSGDDMAALTVANPGNPNPIQQVTGGEPVSFTAPQAAADDLFGYPTDYGLNYYLPPSLDGVPTLTPGTANSHGVPYGQQRVFDGRTLMESQGQAAAGCQDYDFMPAAISAGSSGGGWYQGFDAATGVGTLVGVTSHSSDDTGCLAGIEVTVLWDVLRGGNPSAALGAAMTQPWVTATHLGAEEQAAYDAAQSATFQS